MENIQESTNQNGLKNSGKGSRKYALKFYSNSISTYKAFVDLRSPINVLYHITKKLKSKDPVQTPRGHAGIY